MNNKTLGEILLETINAQGITLDKLASLTNIPKRYLSAMIENDIKNMPAAPYIKGYISKICSSLETDPRPFIDAYKKICLKTSGKDDCLPKNRFALTQKSKNKILIIITVLLVVILGIILTNRHYFFANFIGIPSIEINIPDEMIETTDRFFTISGKVNNRDFVTISGESVAVNAEGYFSKEVLLSDGLNIFEIKAERFLGKETAITRKIFYRIENKGYEMLN